MNNYTTRLIQQQDNVQIASIIRSVLTEFGANKPGTVYYDPTTDDLFSLFSVPNAEYRVLVRDGILYGGAGIYPTSGLPEGCCEVVKLYILAAARGAGLGRQLIYECFEIARKFGYTQVYLETLPELKNAVRLYEQCGFEYLDAPLGNSGHFGCDLWMLKTL
jgi:putative acetyltransferase